MKRNSEKKSSIALAVLYSICSIAWLLLTIIYIRDGQTGVGLAFAGLFVLCGILAVINFKWHDI